MSTPPEKPKVYHIVHVDRLPSVIAQGGLLCDRKVRQLENPGTMIGYTDIKARRLGQNRLQSHPDLFVGDCVPFYFCPRSIMLRTIHRRTKGAGYAQNLAYASGQRPIVHLEADLHKTVAWAEAIGRRWAFTTSNAGSAKIQDYADLAELDTLDWEAVNSQVDAWKALNVSVYNGKQAEFLLEGFFPWELVTRVGVLYYRISETAKEVVASASHRPPVEMMPSWYY